MAVSDQIHRRNSCSNCFRLERLRSNLPSRTSRWAYDVGMRKRHPDTLIPPAGTKARTRKFSKAKPASETHQSIDQQIKAFRKSGKKIQKIPRGVNGHSMEPGARRHIRIGKKQWTD